MITLTTDQKARLQNAIDLYRSKNLDAARAVFAELYGTYRLPDAAYGLGIIALAKGDQGEASEWLTKIEPGDSRYADSRQHLATIGKSRSNTAPVNTLWLPQTDEEFKSYKERETRKEQINWQIQNWGRYPVWVRAICVVVPMVFLLVLAFFLGPVIHKQVSGSESGGAPQSWCQGTYDMWKSNPKFYGQSLIQQLKEARCDRYGIPPPGNQR